jgi:hypothetical protein
VPCCVALGSALKVIVAEKTGRKPDLVVYLEGSPLPARKGPITTRPDIDVDALWQALARLLEE